MKRLLPILFFIGLLFGQDTLRTVSGQKTAKSHGIAISFNPNEGFPSFIFPTGGSASMFDPTFYYVFKSGNLRFEPAVGFTSINQEGSEHIGNHPDFQQYKGKLDMVFTSPPYFDREQYSDDDAQSFKSYPLYHDWRDNFSRPTLENAYNSLKSDRYSLWNIMLSSLNNDDCFLDFILNN